MADDEVAAAEAPKTKDLLTTRLGALSALVIAIGGIITTFVKPPDHSATKAAYEELSKAIEQLNVQNKSDHDDIVALRAYVALKEGQPLFSAPVPTTPPAGAGAGPSRASKPAAVKPLVSVHAPSAAAAAVLLGAPPPAAPGSAVNLFDEDLPPVHAEAPAVHPPAFDAVVKSAAK
jgi:hypothetical protein